MRRLSKNILSAEHQLQIPPSTPPNVSRISCMMQATEGSIPQHGALEGKIFERGTELRLKSTKKGQGMGIMGPGNGVCCISVCLAVLGSIHQECRALDGVASLPEAGNGGYYFRVRCQLAA